MPTPRNDACNKNDGDYRSSSKKANNTPAPVPERAPQQGGVEWMREYVDRVMGRTDICTLRVEQPRQNI